MNSDDENVFSESAQRKRTNIVLSDSEGEDSETVVLIGSTSGDINVPTTPTVSNSTQQQLSQVVLVSTTTTPKRSNGGKKQRTRTRRTDIDNAYSMNFSALFFFIGCTIFRMLISHKN